LTVQYWKDKTFLSPENFIRTGGNMKKTLLGLSMVAALAVSQVKAEVSAVEIRNALNVLTLLDTVQSAQNLINWQVGDFQDHNVKMLFGAGTSHKEATSEDRAQNAIWLKTTIALMGQNQVSEALISRADGKVLKLIVNGEEQAAGEQEVEIIEQAETTITVPAGTYDCMYVKAKITADGKVTDVQLWVNPIDINLDGSLKMVIGSMFGDITMELKQFGPRH
jgi:hypothetical protein